MQATKVGAIVVATLLVPVVGCQYGLEMHIAQGSRVENLVFEISDRGDSEGINVESLYVYRCSDIKDRGSWGFYPKPDQAAWGVAAIELEPKTGPRVTYGVDAEKLESTVGPLPLTSPGCFVVLGYASDRRGDVRVATTGFTVAAGGYVQELTESEYKQIFS